MQTTGGLTARQGLLVLVIMFLLVGLVTVAGAATYGRYDFIYYYNDGAGDQFKGYFFADTSKGFKIGDKYEIAADKNGQKGYYEIKTLSILKDGSSFDKQVFVTNYFDFEEKMWLIPLDYTQPMGTNYWGSETGFIISDKDPTYRFGMYEKTFYEADIIADPKYNGFTFKYTFGSGDWYSGTVYAPSDKYYVGWISYLRDENYDVGFYEVTGRTIGAYDKARNGQVWVDKYYDAESGKSFTPLKSGLGQAAGTYYLTSESDHIKQVHNQYKFGRGTQEADVTDKYYFTYMFKNGDYYKGYFYAGADYYDDGSFKKGYTSAVRDENGLWGAYTITNSYYDYNVGLNGQVFVSSYYDKESNKTFTPLKFSSKDPAGTSYLGSETDYILQNHNQYRFGKGYYEADVTNKYFYTYTFADGDKYDGYFYGPSYYDVGYKSSAIRDEKGKYGFYEITNLDYNFDVALNGQVFISNYYDAESKKNYTPLFATSAKGTKYLGSEVAYIIKDKDNQYRFGKGYYEADVTMRYSYIYQFANGDSYQGYGYAPADYNYDEFFVGYTRKVRDENRKWGRYLITDISYGYVSTTKTWINYNNSSNGQVFATRYYDGESKLTFPTVYPTSVKGTNYLHSETGYIIQDKVNQYKFGKGYYEADVTNRYAFRYTYGDGEWYSGWFYDVAQPDVYKVNQIFKVVKDQTGLWGSYRVTGVTLNQGYQNNGKVMVNQYYYKNGVAHLPGIYVPLKYPSNTYAGTGGIGSEYDYIILGGNSKYRFSGGYYKVDVGL